MFINWFCQSTCFITRLRYLACDNAILSIKQNAKHCTDTLHNIGSVQVIAVYLISGKLRSIIKKKVLNEQATYNQNSC